MKILGPRASGEAVGGGWVYSRVPHELPGNCVADGENYLLQTDRAMIRKGSERAYTTSLGAFAAVSARSHDLDNGQRLRFIVGDNALIGLYASADPTATFRKATAPGFFSVAAASRSMRNAIWAAVSDGVPWRCVPNGDATADADFALAGCRAPLSAGLIGATVQPGAGIGLAAGHYWYAFSILYGTGGEFGESPVGCPTEVTVPGSLDGTARVVNPSWPSDGSGVPVAGSSSIPSSDRRYYHAWGRRLYRTVQGGVRNGPYYLVTQLADMAVSLYMDELSDAELVAGGAATKRLNDDPRIPPFASFCETHEGLMLWGTVWPSRVYWSEFGKPDLTGSDDFFDVPDPLTAIASVRGQAYAFSPDTVLQLEPGAGSRLISSGMGCTAPEAMAYGVDGVYITTTKGPHFYDGSQFYPLGGTDRAQRIKDYLDDYCFEQDQIVGTRAGGFYYLAYPDRRDVPGLNNPQTRVLAYSENQRAWTVPFTGMRAGVWMPEGDVLYFMDSESGCLMMRFADVTTDYRTGTGSAAAFVPRLRSGNLSGAAAGDLTVPYGYAVRASNVPGVAGTIATVTSGTVGTTRTVTGSPTSNPALTTGRIAPSMSRWIQHELSGFESVESWNVEMTRRAG